MDEYNHHQFSLFQFKPPVKKFKINSDQIREVQTELEKGKNGNQKIILQGLRSLNDSLERLEKIIK